MAIAIVLMRSLLSKKFIFKIFHTVLYPKQEAQTIREKVKIKYFGLWN